MKYTAEHPLPLAVLISGNGSNLQAIIDAIQQGDLHAKVAVVISDRPDAYGLERARQAGIPTEVLTSQENRTRYDEHLLKLLEKYQVDLVILAGFMRILGPKIVKHFEKRMLNIHPSLLPKFPGLHPHQRVIEAGEKEHGATVHYVTNDLDAGPIIAQAKCTIDPLDTPEILKTKVQTLEHQLYPQAIQWWAEHYSE